MRGMFLRFAVGCGLVAAIASPAVADDGVVDLDAPAAAPAPPDPSARLDQSAALSRSAMTHYDAERWREARADFIAAYEAYPHDELLFYIGDTYRREGANRTALMYFNRYLESSPPGSMLHRDAQQYAASLNRALDEGALMGGEVPVPGALAGAPPVAEPTPMPMSSTEPPDDSRANARLAFAVSGVLTIGVAGFWGYSASRVLHFEDEKEQALIDAAQSGVTFDAKDACADAEGRSGTQAARVDDACTSGRRWATVTNASLVTALIGVGVTSYLGYRAFIAGPDTGERTVVVVEPSVGPTTISVTTTLRF